MTPNQLEQLQEIARQVLGEHAQVHANTYGPIGRNMTETVDVHVPAMQMRLALPGDGRFNFAALLFRDQLMRAVNRPSTTPSFATSAPTWSAGWNAPGTDRLHPADDVPAPVTAKTVWARLLEDSLPQG